MTEEQTRAYEYLERYHQATIRASGLERQVERLRAEAENIKSTSAVEMGWTGRMETDKRGRKIKVMAPVPRGGNGSGGNDKITNTMCDLADKSTELDEQRKLCDQLLAETEHAIAARVEDETKRVALTLRHIDRLSYEMIGNVVKYSTSHARKIYYEALQELGSER